MPTAQRRPRPPLPAGPFLVVGLARSGAAAAAALAARGEAVLGSDAGRPPEARRLEGAGVEVHLDADGVELLDGVSAVVKSPGVPQGAPVIEAAQARGLRVIGELELGWRLLPNRFVGVTGTNGKTTVTELIAHIYRTAGRPVAVAGNVGTPLASLAGALERDATVVCECSSFQLEDSEAFAPECAVLLNLSPDHLDRHATIEDYLDAKLRIFANQRGGDVAVYNGAEPRVAGGELPGEARRIAFCHGERTPAGDGCEVELERGVIRWRGEPLLAAAELRLLGEHNVENAMAAAAAALAMGVEMEAVREGLRGFAAIPHRLEAVAKIEGVGFVNDSKATNAAAATAAIRSFEDGVRAILGGSLKGEGFEPLREPIAERCAACYLIGEAAERLERDLEPVRARGVEVHRCAGLEDAVRAAARDAERGEVVLLAPACASFDAYRDFEERGEHFRALVEELR